MSQENDTTNPSTSAANGLTEEQKHELVTAIANDIYRRATLSQTIQLVQTQCTNQAATIVQNATPEEIATFLEQLKDNTADNSK